MNSILSIFLNNKKCYAATNESRAMIECSTIQKVSDVFIPMLSNLPEIREINKIIFPIGPGSFTSIRVINSVVKGFSIVGHRELIPVSSFLPFFIALPESIKTGTIAISTGRGDYFCAQFNNNIIERELSIVSSVYDLQNAFLDKDEIFADINLADVMLTNIDSPKAALNINNSSNKTPCEPTYGFSPNYTARL
ncbi:MAG: hypothetical protein LBG13_00855 [Holosporales bacterium]|jgi:tRNA A37 threonylcarbamoyladenosine modification protein TsaB|nr:hypothetical protein [Holosporales bacterium]